MPGNPDRSLTIDTDHHILPDFFWKETENAHAPVGGLAPLQWSKEASISFMDDAGIDVAVVSPYSCSNTTLIAYLSSRPTDLQANLVSQTDARGLTRVSTG